ncbi:MAG: Type 4 prepilin-like protein leader peptide-processing enzyme [Parcubacteria group bacterium GW2011_GWF2_43_11]|nr:MAG: Type 4 prepilin-like protein leader peptide-processing enzyme [Parcubacteria group bacterium GW2011_GWF2_43_11]
MATPFLFFIVLLFGLTAGSFLNCVVYRLENNQSFLTGRSFCPKCKHVLAWYDLMPVLSFLLLGGKCRHCQKKISFQYPLVEIAVALLFLAIFYYRLPVFSYFLSLFLIVIFIYDLKHYLILDKVIYPAIGLTLIYDLLRFDLFTNWNLLISAIGASGFFLLIVLASRGKWMGVGDIKLAFLMGLILGWPNILVALFFAFLSGATIGVGLVLARRKSFKSEVPFGPFLVAGTIVAMFYGQALINWYLNLYV